MWHKSLMRTRQLSGFLWQRRRSRGVLSILRSASNSEKRAESPSKTGKPIVLCLYITYFIPNHHITHHITYFSSTVHVETRKVIIAQLLKKPANSSELSS